MIVVGDTTVFIHLLDQYGKMTAILKKLGVKKMYITRIGYIELLAGAKKSRKVDTRKFLSDYPILEFNEKAASITALLSMKYQVSSKNSKDFLIAATCISHNLSLLTENNKDFNYKELKLQQYRIDNSF
jgi:predicted nucleic acid-binding protein